MNKHEIAQVITGLAARAPARLQQAAQAAADQLESEFRAEEAARIEAEQLAADIAALEAAKLAEAKPEPKSTRKHS